jgi:lysozyme
MERTRAGLAAAVRPFAPGGRLQDAHMPAFRAFADALKLPPDGAPAGAAPRLSTGHKTAGGLVGIVGAVAAASLFVSVPADESGRKVEATVRTDGAVEVRHISGPQHLRAYRDIAGIATACDGITRDVRMGQSFTEEQCTIMLERELVAHARGVMNCTPGLQGAGRDHQRAAAVSLAYNIGVGAWCKSTAARLFNQGQYRAGCNAFLSWNKARVNGQLRVVQGLTNRRQRERAECLKGLQ